MATVKLLTDEEIAANLRLQAVFNDIRATRKSDFVNNFWRALANQPALLEHTWADLKRVMIEPGSLDPLTKELIYIAVSTTNACSYCVHSHTAARAKGLTEDQYADFLAVVRMASQTNARYRPASPLRPGVCPLSRKLRRQPAIVPTRGVGMHDIVTVGIPLIAILAGILFNRIDMRELRSEMRAELHRLNNKIDSIDAKLSGKIDSVESKLDARIDEVDRKIEEVRASGHRDSLEILRALTTLHERVAIVEDRQNR